jgi:hypothetical protein
VLIAIVGAGYAFSDGPNCAWGFVGCGPESNECRADCPGSVDPENPTGMNCMPNGNPFDMCVCEFMFCVTAQCDDVDT